MIPKALARGQIATPQRVHAHKAAGSEGAPTARHESVMGAGGPCGRGGRLLRAKDHATEGAFSAITGGVGMQGTTWS